MSFGRAASRGGSARSIETTAPCPCGSGDPFGGCCGPVLRGQPAPTAERLMRSRYTAFLVGDAEHLAASWHPRTRPEEITVDPSVRWTGLRIDAVEEGGANDTRGIVEFTASWMHRSGRDDIAGALRERSRFVRQSGRWWYLDGDVD
jgi:SEC-C motif-containing protein